MRKLLNLLAPVLGLSLGSLNYANAQTQDTITINKMSTVVEEKYNQDRTISEKKEYIVEKTSQEVNGKPLLETETKYRLEEKDLGKSGGQKNLLNRTQIDKLLDYVIINQFQHDSLGRLIEIEKVEDYSPGENIKKRSKTHYIYEGENKAPVKIWEDLNNNGKFDAGDKMRVYVSELDKWVSQGE